MIAATNRPDMIDPAMVRPGRLDKLLYVDLPAADERAEIIRTMTRKVPLGGESTTAQDVEIGVEKLVRERCEGYSGADLAAIVREAGVIALKRTLGALDEMEEQDGMDPMKTPTPTMTVHLLDFVKAVEKVSPSVSVAQRRRYEALRSKFAGLPVRTRKERTEEEEKRVNGSDKVV